MYTDDWLNVLNQIPKNSRITLTGGDPLMFKDFEKIFEKANQIAETNMITNGLLINDQKMEKLRKEIQSVVDIFTSGNLSKAEILTKEPLGEEL